MKAYIAKNIRNVALIGHNSVGKTMLLEALAFNTGLTSRLGSIEDGTTISDYTADEIEKQYSIASSIAALESFGKKFNIIDCPGYADFIGETYNAIRVADTALITVSATNYQQTDVGTERGYEIAGGLKKPVAFFVNKCDYDTSNYEKTVEKLQISFSKSVTPLQFPAGEGDDLKGIIDIVDMKLYSSSDKGRVTEEIPEGFKAKAEAMREVLVENVAGTDEKLMDKYFENGELSVEDFENGFTKAFVSGDIFPIFCGSALKGMGVMTLLERMSTLFPSPLENPIHGLRDDKPFDLHVNKDEKTSCFVFKTVNEHHVGDLSFFKIITGHLKAGDELYNNGKSERIGAINFITGKTRVETPEMLAGDIGAAVKLKSTKTNDTLAEKSVDYIIRPIRMPSSLIWEAINTKDKKDDTKIGQALNALSNEDPTFGYEINPELHQTIIHGQGVKHIDTVMKKLKDRFNIDVDLIEPKIPYRETITASVEGSYRHKKQSGGKGQFGEVHMRMKPTERGAGYTFKNGISGGSIPARFIPAVEKGVNETLVDGVISGSQVVDIEVELYYGKFHDVDSSEMAFKIASRMCFKDLFKKAKPILLEPINDIRISCPAEYTGDIMGDISGKRGRPEGMEEKNGKQIITAKVPLSEIYRYSTTLRTMTQGKGSFETEFSHYEIMPGDVQKKIVDKYEASRGHAEEE